MRASDGSVLAVCAAVSTVEHSGAAVRLVAGLRHALPTPREGHQGRAAQQFYCASPAVRPCVQRLYVALLAPPSCVDCVDARAGQLRGLRGGRACWAVAAWTRVLGCAAQRGVWPHRLMAPCAPSLVLLRVVRALRGDVPDDLGAQQSPGWDAGA